MCKYSKKAGTDGAWPGHYTKGTSPFPEERTLAIPIPYTTPPFHAVYARPVVTLVVPSYM